MHVTTIIYHLVGITQVKIIMVMQCGVSMATCGIGVFPSLLYYMTVDKQCASICVEVYWLWFALYDRCAFVRVREREREREYLRGKLPV